MEPYFKKNIFTESMVVSPEYLNSNLFSNLKLLLTKKYPKTYLNKGYIYNIKILKISDNKITLSGQIVLMVEFEANIYTPQIGHIFQGKVKQSPMDFKKFKWVEIDDSLKIFVDSKTADDKILNIQITNVKSDNTFCFGKII